MVSRGEVWLISLDPTVGSEIRKTRPCLVVSPPEIHDHMKTVLAAPMTTGGRNAPFRIPVKFQGKDGFIALDQIRALDKRRLVLRLGAVSKSMLSTTLAALRTTFED